MKTVVGEMILNGTTYKATEIDFDQYYAESGQITLSGQVRKAIKMIGIEDSLLCGEEVFCDENTLVG